MPTFSRILVAFAALVIYASPAAAEEVLGRVPAPQPAIQDTAKCLEGYVMTDGGKCELNVPPADPALLGSISNRAVECPTGTLANEGGECISPNSRMTCPSGYTRTGIGDTCGEIIPNTGPAMPLLKQPCSQPGFVRNAEGLCQKPAH